MCSCDFEPADFTTSAVRKARKPHSCLECGVAIRPGDRYVHTAMGFDGHVDTWSECLDCDAWGKAFAEAQRAECGCSGWAAGCLWEAVTEFAEEYLSDRAMARKAREAERKARMATIVMGAP